MDATMTSWREDIVAGFRQLQDTLCEGLVRLEQSCNGSGFVEDAWERPGGGGGRTRVLSEGAVWERGGVNFSDVHGEVSRGLAEQLGTTASSFMASGVSLVLHPQNPWVPIVHMNVRHFALSDGTQWFGGGIDLTPHYVVPTQAGAFHRVLREVCDAHVVADYNRFKREADDYFFLPHRDETRGVGGVFFDHLGREGHGDWDACWAFVLALGNSFLPAYVPLVEAAKDQPFTNEQRDWQLHRRGRYAEFNLVWDRGTRFGLVSQGRTESILMSLPPEVRWTYDHQPGPLERDTLSWLRKDVDWVNH
ncbi:MAG: oxygen-dependent coproporphyrinogen oxidase [Bacteroidetes bacterium]|nr:oxygen-dependent coproporphyrinogen oxidase [Bacteroidota bacterium]MDA0904356.1 oxygen-dependent coproporphyrinogen oxidase [Bacteroidota bacterium]MDA1243095.1 oxygen-dependent coproporphyrinogen oxidase [Bacteroidota bacterium]